MTRSPAGPNPAQWGRREPVSFGTGCTGDCVSSRPSDGPGSHVPAALEEIRERNTHRQSASNPYGRRRFVNFVVLDASEPYFTKSELRLRIPELLAKPVNRPVEWNSARGMRRIQVRHTGYSVVRLTGWRRWFSSYRLSHYEPYYPNG